MVHLGPTLLVSALMLIVFGFCFSAQSGHFRSLSVDHFGSHVGTLSDIIWIPFRTSLLNRKLTRGDTISNSETSIRTKMRTRQFELCKSSSAVRTRPLTRLRAHGLELDLQNDLQLELEHESDIELTSASNAHSSSNHHARTPTRTRTRHPTQTCARARNPGLAELPLHFFPNVFVGFLGGEE